MNISWEEKGHEKINGTLMWNGTELSLETHRQQVPGRCSKKQSVRCICRSVKVVITSPRLKNLNKLGEDDGQMTTRAF